MNALRTVAKLARMGDLEAIQKFLNEEQFVNEAVRNGFYDADRETGRDRQSPLAHDPLEAIAEHNAAPGRWSSRIGTKLAA